MHFVPKDVLLHKENEQIDLRVPPSKIELYFLLNVTKSKIFGKCGHLVLFLITKEKLLLKLTIGVL